MACVRDVAPLSANTTVLPVSPKRKATDFKVVTLDSQILPKRSKLIGQ